MKARHEWVYRGLGDLSNSGDVEIPIRLRHGASISVIYPVLDMWKHISQNIDGDTGILNWRIDAGKSSLGRPREVP